MCVRVWFVAGSSPSQSLVGRIMLPYYHIITISFPCHYHTAACDMCLSACVHVCVRVSTLHQIFNCFSLCCSLSLSLSLARSHTHTHTHTHSQMLTHIHTHNPPQEYTHPPDMRPLFFSVSDSISLSLSHIHVSAS